MPTDVQSPEVTAEPVVAGERRSRVASATPVALLTGGIDRPYAFGITVALGSRGVPMDVIAGTELDCPEIRQLPSVTFRNLHGDLRRVQGFAKKLLFHLAVYARLISYSLTARPKIFHILWNYKFEVFDRTILMLYYKLLGKKVVLTAHNVNAATRDGNESVINRLSLKVQYRLTDHVFVHTEAMRTELMKQFGVSSDAVTTIPFGVNNSVPDTELTTAEARQKLGLRNGDKAILFFGRLRPYKGLHHLVDAFARLAAQDRSYRLIIAGEPKKDTFEYWNELCQAMDAQPWGERVIREARYIRDEETELFFKAADVVVLPYTSIFQSGVLFLGYSFGLPVIATDVGALGDDVVEAETGFVCRPGDVTDLTNTISRYFASALYRNLERQRPAIRAFVASRNSWQAVSDTTLKVYADLLANK